MKNAGNREVSIAGRLLGLEPEKSVKETEKEAARFGTFDMSVPVSEVPCGGCGAMLHCQDPAIPGNLLYSYFFS